MIGRTRSGAPWPLRRINKCIAIVDADGLVHCQGEITPSEDFTECGQRIRGVEGWHAVDPTRHRPWRHGTRFCEPCRHAAARHRLGRVGRTKPPRGER